MADIRLTEGQAWGGVPRKYIDNGDGTFSELVSLENGGGATAIADGADVNAGSTTDAAITSNAVGTMSGKLRGIVTILADTWNNAANAFQIAVLDGLDANAGSTTDSAVISDIDATMSAKLRGIVTILADVWDNSTNSFRAQGTTAIDGSATGNPLLIGANTFDGAKWIAGDADVVPPSSPNGVAMFTRPLSESGYSYGNTQVSILIPGARTTTQVVTVSTLNQVCKGILLFVDVTSAGTGSITPSIQVRGPNSANFFTIWTAASALTTNGVRAYYLYPGASGGSFTEIVSCGLPGVEWQVTITHNNANSATYGVGAVLMM